MDKYSKRTKYSTNELHDAVARYKGHPYAVGAALELIEDGLEIQKLPNDPRPIAIAEAQWGRICERGDDAIALFEAYAVLEVGVPDEVVQKVGGLSATTRKRLQNDSYLRGLLREEGEGKRIYHAILVDHIIEQIGDAEKNQYHSRAVEVYRGKLARAEKEQIRPDALAATRLAEHVLSAEGKEAFVYAFVSECTRPLINLGLLDVAFGFSERALGMVEKESEEEAMVTGNLGLIYYTRGELDKAEETFKKILEIHEELDDEEGKAKDYGNLGLIYRDKGELDKAEEMHRKALQIDKKSGRLEGIALRYAALGIVYDSRGKPDEAEKIHLKGLEIEKKIGRLVGIARQYGNLGITYMHKGELDKAEEMFLKSLEISQPRGMLELTANQYSNLGLIYEQRGDIGTAREYWEKAVGLYKKIGMPHMVEKAQGLLDGLGTE